MKYFPVLLIFFSVFSCTTKIDSYTEISKAASIYPEYEGTVIPYNIAPVNFQIREKADKFLVRYVIAGKDSFSVETKLEIKVPIKSWKRLLENNTGETLSVKIFAKKNDEWVKFEDINFTVAKEKIDPYVAYRLIEPGYEIWNKMGLYQRCVENFEETPILDNSLTDNNCMNCHSFCNNDPELMLFHMRGKHAGTMLSMYGDVNKLNTKTPTMMSAGVYPRWNPKGKYVAFSTNSTNQGFLAAHTNKIEVFDKASDIVLYDTQTNKMTTTELLSSPLSYETFPEWSPDGKTLYFCSAPALKMPEQYDTIRYSLISIDFNPETGQFGSKADTLINAYEINKSTAFPRVSPNGEKLVLCMFDYGTFPIWHRENDLYLLDLKTRSLENIVNINSNESDSYHSWSSNGKWMVFGSRRIDGQYTRLFISYFDDNGKFHKPFLLPQKEPLYYDYLMKSYNVPECIKGKVRISAKRFAEAAQKEALQVMNK